MFKFFKKIFNKRFAKLFISCGLILLASFSLSSCQSVDKSNSFAGIETSCMRSDDGKSTLVHAEITIYNDTIYDIDYVSFVFDSYNNGVYLFTSDENSWNVTIKHGSEYVISFNDLVENKIIDNVKINHWYSNFLSFSETYMIWLIVVPCLTLVALIGYAVWVFVSDINLDEVFDEISNMALGWIVYTIPILIPGLVSTLYSLPGFGWIPICLVGAGVIVFLLLALVVHLIHYIVLNFGLGMDRYELPLDRESLALYTKADLVSYCKNNCISGYSSLNKDDLISLILGEDVGKSNSQKSTKTNALDNKNTMQSNKKHKITFDDIAGLEEAKEAFKEKVILPFKYPEMFEKYNKKAGGGILLYGLPGTGKTMFAEAASNEVDALFIPIKCSDIKSKWYGESEENVKKIFNKARKAKRAIIFFDEFEAIGAKRNGDSDNGNNDLVPEILAEMQGVGNNDSCIVVIAATNKPWSIDSAFMRPGRFDEKIYIPLPDDAARRKLFELNLKDVPMEDGIDLNEIVSSTDGFNGADIKEVCEQIKLVGIKNSIKLNCDYKITLNDIKDIIEKSRTSVSKEDIEDLKNFENEMN